MSSRRGWRSLIAMLLGAGFGWASPASAAPLWTAPATLSPTDESASAPQIAVAGDGTALAVWEQLDREYRWRVRASRFNGSTWEPAADLSGPEAIARRPQVDVDDRGRAVVAWDHYVGTKLRVRAATFSGGAWSPSVVLSNTANAGAGQHVAIDDEGKAITVWFEYDGVSSRTWASRFDGTAWGPATALSTAGPDESTYEARVDFDGNGNALSVWRQGTFPISQVWASRFDGVTWSPAQALSDVSQQVGQFPQLAVTDAGRAIAVWDDDSSPAGGVWSSRFDGTMWLPPVALSDGAVNAREPRVAVNRAGHAVAVWHQLSHELGSTTGRIWESRFDGNTWSAPHGVSEPGHSDTYPQVTVAQDGTATVLWQRSEWNKWRLRAARSDDEWASGQDLGDLSSGTLNPQLSADGAGNVIAVWSRFDEAQGVVQSAGLDVNPPAITVTTPLATQTVASGQNLVAEFRCTDPVGFGLGDPGCTATVTGPGAEATPISSGEALPTDDIGAYALTVTATDRSANVVSTTTPYTVKHQQPIPTLLGLLNDVLCGTLGQVTQWVSAWTSVAH